MSEEIKAPPVIRVEGSITISLEAYRQLGEAINRFEEALNDIENGNPDAYWPSIKELHDLGMAAKKKAYEELGI